MAGGIKGLQELAKENGQSLEGITGMLQAQGVSTTLLSKQMAELQADVSDIKTTAKSIEAKADSIGQVRQQ